MHTATRRKFDLGIGSPGCWKVDERRLESDFAKYDSRISLLRELNSKDQSQLESLLSVSPRTRGRISSPKSDPLALCSL
jgi:hypothetical protein